MSVRVVEMRKWPRLEINAPAKIIVMSTGLHIKETLDCKVINISEGGALVVAESPITASEFYLEESGARETLHLCSVVRRESKFKVGVRFLQDRVTQD
jgi:PilZ domain